MLDGTDARLEPVLDVILSLLAVQRDLRRAELRVGIAAAPNHTISLTELGVLFVVRVKPLNQVSIAHALHLDKSTVNVAVRRLRDVEAWLADTSLGGVLLTAEGEHALSYAETSALAAVARLVGRPLTRRELNAVRLLARWLRRTRLGIRSEAQYRAVRE